jgi:hypothetical protein
MFACYPAKSSTLASRTMRHVTEDPDTRADIWPYVDCLELDRLSLTTIGDIHHVYREAGERFDQVLIGSEPPTTFLVIVVDRASRAVLGHHLLDLSEKYRL